QIKQALIQCRVPNAKHINVADVLSKSGDLVDAAGLFGNARLWRLTGVGEAHVRKLLGLPESEPEIEHDVSSLKKLVARITDPVIKGLIEESVTCLQVGALRAGVVFLWAGAVRTLQEEALSKGIPQVNAAVQVHDPKARQIKTVDDFQYLKDKTF